MRLPVSWTCTSALALALLAATPRAHGAECETCLAGFALQQLRAGIEAELGKPYQTIDGDHGQSVVFAIDADSYMVFGFVRPRSNQVDSIQLTGSATTLAAPFRGLTLGDPEPKVRAALGSPSSTRSIADPPVEVWNYDGTNYSIELDAGRRLYSIRIRTTRDFMTNTAEVGADFTAFANAVKDGDATRAITMLRPDFEIYRGKAVLSAKRRWAAFTGSPDPEVAAALVGVSASVRAALRQGLPKPEFRVAEHEGVGEVYKFPADSPLREIVLFPYAGRLRVYEIAFR